MQGDGHLKWQRGVKVNSRKEGAISCFFENESHATIEDCANLKKPLGKERAQPLLGDHYIVK